MIQIRTYQKLILYCGKKFKTVILEDLITMAIAMIIVGIVLISDPESRQAG